MVGSSSIITYDETWGRMLGELELSLELELELELESKLWLRGLPAAWRWRLKGGWELRVFVEQSVSRNVLRDVRIEV